MENILTSIKKLLGLTEEYDAFDQDILMHINSVVSVLALKGVGPSSGFIVTEDTTWEEYIGNRSDLMMIRTYIYLRVRILFDPPTSSFVLDGITEQMKELEFYLSTLSDNT